MSLEYKDLILSLLERVGRLKQLQTRNDFTQPCDKRLYYSGMKEVTKSLNRLVEPSTKARTNDLSYEGGKHYLHFVSRCFLDAVATAALSRSHMSSVNKFQMSWSVGPPAAATMEADRAGSCTTGFSPSGCSKTSRHLVGLLAVDATRLTSGSGRIFCCFLVWAWVSWSSCAQFHLGKYC